MKIEIVFKANDCEKNLVKNKNSAVIDVLRATTVVTTALANGASAVYTFQTVEEALRYSKLNREKNVLAGERFSDKIAGFDFGNSPFDFNRENIENKELILTTTNGTIAIHNAKSSENLYIACFLNFEAVAKKLMEDNLDVVLVCSGTNGRFSLEDGLCAGAIAKFICKNSETKLDDGAKLMKEYYESNEDLHKVLFDSSHYINLADKGYLDDLDFCLRKNIYDIVPFYHEGKITIN